MRYLQTTLAAILFIFTFQLAFSKAGDTLYVQTFTFGSQQDSVFKFPDQSKEYRKVLMYYTLKCNSKQNPACGQWDYLTYTYLYRHTGKYDSVVSKIDTLRDTSGNITEIDTTWKQREILDRIELGRYITPYGIGLSLGNGFTWVFDVSDYESLLHDSVHLAAGNWQELLDLKFAFIEGSPARKPYKVENVWVGNFPYGTSKSIEEYLSARKITIDSAASEVRMKVRVTGHGFGGNENCSEFCAKTHSLMVNGVQEWSKLVWRDNCGYNPVFPQGGTWVYNRANWCPGAEVETYDIELTPYITPGKEVTLDYNIEPYTWNGQGTTPYYATEIQLVYYKAPKYKLDASIDQIVAPARADMLKRINPICGNPDVVIQNTGTSTLTSLHFSYGVVGGPQTTYDWKGTLEYQQKTHVVLPMPDYYGKGFPAFKVSISKPNDGQDENQLNDTACSLIPLTQVLPSNFVIWLRTNNAPAENKYTISDAADNVLYTRENMAANTLYKDTVRLGNGCYQFHLTDTDNDGLSWWANSDGTGYVRLADLSNKTLKTFNADFGAEVLYNFNTGWGLAIKDYENEEKIGLYPNPSNGDVTLDYSLLNTNTGTLRVYSLTGRVLLERQIAASDGGEIHLGLQGYGAGIYFVQLLAKDKLYTERLVLIR